MTVDSLGQSSPPVSGDTDTVAVAASKTTVKNFDKDDGPSFSDIIDVLNPLQHIPVINTIYQHITGDKEGAVADLVGGMIWGGPIGLGAAMANLVVEDNTGKSISDNVIGIFSDEPQGAVAVNGTARPVTTASRTDAPETTTAAVLPEPVETLPVDGTATTPATGATTASPAPVSAGGFMIFGASQPGSQTAPQAATRTLGGTDPAAQAAVTGIPGVPAGQTTAMAQQGAPVTTASTRARTPAASRGLDVANAETTGTTPAVAGSDNGAPTRAGDFLVFGGRTAAVQGSANQATPSQAAMSLSQPQQAQSGQAQSGQAQSGQAQPQQNGGPRPGSQQMASLPADTQPVPLTPSTAPALAAQQAAQANAQQATGGRRFATPPRTGPSAPPQTLPLPTTGPAAVPGNARAAAANRGGDNGWFIASFNQAMDKYDRAAKLGTESGTGSQETGATPAAPVK
ncbi:MAG: hypothetical protein F8N37_10015 [Telmatospirillum sp.]|nr:hypothetical protein [Telmatospirillum sp.]